MSIPRDFAYHTLSFMLDTFWAMKVCAFILVDELYQREHYSNETYGRFQRSNRRAGRSGC